MKGCGRGARLSPTSPGRSRAGCAISRQPLARISTPGRRYPTIASLKALLAQEHAVTQKQFAADPNTALAQVCSLPWGAQVTMEWVIWHVLEHEIHHRGEIYLMLGLLGIEAPDV